MTHPLEIWVRRSEMGRRS